MKIIPDSHYGTVILIIQALNTYGVDAKNLLQELGIDPHHFQDGIHRVPLELITRLIRESIDRSGDPAFGLVAGSLVSPASFHALGVSLLYSNDLRDFCQRLERYHSLISTYKTAKFLENETEIKLYQALTERNVADETRDFDADYFLSAALRFIRISCGFHYVPEWADVEWVPPEDCQHRYRELCGCDVNFGARQTAIYFRPDDLEFEFPNHNAELARQNDTVVIDYLNRTKKVDLPEQVFAKLIEFLPSGECSREKVSFALNMSVSAFHNKLKVAGTNYQEILDKTRRALAVEYIGQKGLSICDTAYLLGFTDSSNFSRAFKRWVGATPREYRNKYFLGVESEH